MRAEIQRMHEGQSGTLTGKAVVNAESERTVSRIVEDSPPVGAGHRKHAQPPVLNAAGR
jgi:hypothetical protein